MSYVNGVYASSDVNSTTFNVSYSPAQHNALAVFGFAYLSGGNNNTFSDNAAGGSNTYVGVDTVDDGSRTGSFYVKDCKSGVTTITMGSGGNPQYHRVQILEYSGMHLTALLEDHAVTAGGLSGSGTDSSTTGNGAGTSTAGCTIIGMGIQTSDQVHPAPGTGFTQRLINDEGAGDCSFAEDRVMAGTGTPDAATWTIATGKFIYMYMMAFAPAVGGSGTPFASRGAPRGMARGYGR